MNNEDKQIILNYFHQFRDGRKEAVNDLYFHLEGVIKRERSSSFEEGYHEAAGIAMTAIEMINEK